MNQQKHFLLQKYETDHSFKHQIDINYNKYFKLCQEGYLTNLDMIPDNIIQVFPGYDIDLFFYYGFLQPTKSNQYQKLILYFMKNFNQKPLKPYIFVFFNNGTKSNSAFNQFKQMFLLLTLDHFLFLQQFIVIKAGFMHKALDYITFGALNQYLKSKTIYLSNSKHLCDKLKLNPFNFMNFIPQKIYNDEKSNFPKYQKQPIKTSNQRQNIIGHQINKQQKQQKNKFQNQMTSLMVKRPGKQTHQISDYQLSQIGIPLVLQLLVAYFKNDESGLFQEGLFRKNVSIDEQNQTLSQLSKQNYDCLQKIANPHIVANLIKRFFANLKTPVIPFKQFQQLMNDQGVINKVQHVKKMAQSLPQVNFLSLAFLIQFLKDQVIPKQSSNKMTAQSISICFSPCLLRAQKASTADIIYASKTVIYVKIMITDFNEVFGGQQKIMKLFRTSYMQKKQTFHNTIDLIIQDSPLKRNTLSVKPQLQGKNSRHNSSQSNKSNASEKNKNRPKIFQNNTNKEIKSQISVQKSQNNEVNNAQRPSSQMINSQKQLILQIPQSNIKIQCMGNLKSKIIQKTEINKNNQNFSEQSDNKKDCS